MQKPTKSTPLAFLTMADVMFYMHNRPLFRNLLSGTQPPPIPRPNWRKGVKNKARLNKQRK